MHSIPQIEFGLPSLLVITFAGVVTLAGVLLWVNKWAFQSRMFPAESKWHRSLTMAGSVLFVGGILGVGFAFLEFVAIPLWIAVLIVAVMLRRRVRSSDRRLFLATLATEAERGLPLDEIVRAYGAACPDPMGTQVALLGDYLEAGLPLSQAMVRVPRAVPQNAAIAATIGERINALAPALRMAEKQLSRFEIVWRITVDKLAYFLVLTLVMAVILSFVMIKIVPVYEKMFVEFELRLPPPTVVLIRLSRGFFNYFYVAFPLVLFPIIVFFAGLFSYTGQLARDIPLLNRLALRLDVATMLRYLSLAVRSGRPVIDMWDVLAECFPRTLIRRRLGRVAASARDGQDGCESLRQVRLITSAEVSVLLASQRTGNLAWALDELADSITRRREFRVRCWLQILFPVVLLVFGACILFFAVAMMLPLADLIEKLS